MRLPKPTFGKVLAGTAVLLLATTGTAYAANTVGSGDIIDDSVLSVDIKNETLQSVDVLNNSLISADIKNNTLVSNDINDGTIASIDILDGTIGSADVADGSLTGADILDNSVTTDDVAPLHGDADIQDNTITTFDIATDAIDSDEVLDFGLSNEDVAVLGVAVNADGTVDHSQGSGITASRISTGNYEVGFGRNVAFCVYTATIGTGPVGNSASGFIDVSPRAGNPNAVFVNTNSAANAGTDLPFHLVVVC